MQREARSAGLHYSGDSGPGLGRRRRGRGFSYHDASGALITDGEERERLQSLAIPPAWTDVWINPDPRGHLQATGRDEAGRKQYIYHPRWLESRAESKYGSLSDFAQHLPALRRRLRRHLAESPDTPDHRTVTAAVVSLLDRSLIRIGNRRYAQQNDSYGLTTLRETHVEVTGSELQFRFRGKSGQEHDVSIRNRSLARVVKSCLELPGQELFRYENEVGELRTVSSGDVNAYLHDVLGEGHSAKDFRTWAGTVLTAERLAQLPPEDTAGKGRLKRELTAALRATAGRLGNTLAVCRSSYVHPAISDSWLEGTFRVSWADALEQARAGQPAELRLAEAATLNFLEAAGR